MRPKKDIPLETVTVKGLKDLLNEGMTHQQIADYYGVERSTISKKIKELNIKRD